MLENFAYLDIMLFFGLVLMLHIKVNNFSVMWECFPLKYTYKYQNLMHWPKY